MFFMANNIVEEQGEGNEEANLAVQKRKGAIFLIEIVPKPSFLPYLATTLAPLTELLKKGVQLAWTKECQQAYEACKQNLTSDTLLVHYEGSRERRLACDASSYGIGAVISHVMDDGRE